MGTYCKDLPLTLRVGESLEPIMKKILFELGIEIVCVKTMALKDMIVIMVRSMRP